MSWTLFRPRLPQDPHRVFLKGGNESSEANWDSDKSLWFMDCQTEEHRDLAMRHGWKEVERESSAHDLKGLLDQTVDQIKDQLPNLELDEEDLNGMQILESAGQKRKGVRKAIQQARRTLKRS